MDPLIAAALRDQERRVLEASPKALSGAQREPLNGDTFLGRCGICGGKLMRHNRSGLCSRTKECRSALQRLYMDRRNESRRKHGRE